PGRKHRLQPYGYVFRREFLVRAGAQMATYVNEYDPFNTLRGSYDKIFELALKSKFKGVSWRILPFVSAMRESYDYTWEREWRIIEELQFRYRDLVCVVMPQEDQVGRDRWLRHGVPVISPGWTYEQMIVEFRQQH